MILTQRQLSYSASALCALGIISFIIYPLLALAWESLRDADTFSLIHYQAAFSGAALESIWNSLWVSLISTLAAACIGVPVSLLLFHYNFWGRRICFVAMFAPLMLPPLVGMFAFWLLYGDIGFFPNALAALFSSDRPFAGISGINAVILVHAYSFSVYFFALCSASLQRIDPSLSEAARSLGASLWQRFKDITLPQLWPSIISAAALCFMMSMGSFSAPYILANSTPFLSVLIYEVSFAEGVVDAQHGLAAALSVIGAIICIGFLCIARRWQQQGQSQRGVKVHVIKSLHSWKQICASIAALGLSLFMLLPHVYIAVIAFADYPAWDEGLLPSSYTIDNFASIFASDNALRPMFNSAFYSLVALIACLSACLLASSLIVKSKLPGAFLIDFSFMLPLALPGTVIAFSLLRAFSVPTLGIILAHSVWILPLAYCIRCLPLAIRPLITSLESADPAHDEAARSLGASRLRRLVHVFIPHMWPAIIAASILVFVTCLGEFVASFMLYRHGNLPISVYMYQIMQSGIAQAAAYSVLLIVCMLASAALQQLLKRRNHLG